MHLTLQISLCFSPVVQLLAAVGASSPPHQRLLCACSWASFIMVVSRQYRRGFRVTACAVNVWLVCWTHSHLPHRQNEVSPCPASSKQYSCVSGTARIYTTYIYIYKILNWRYSIAAFFLYITMDFTWVIPYSCFFVSFLQLYRLRCKKNK